MSRWNQVLNDCVAPANESSMHTRESNIMKMHIQALFLLLVFLVSGPAAASGISSSSLDELMKLSGITKQVSEIQANVLAALEQGMQQGGTVNDDLYAELQTALATAFSPGDINDTVSREVENTLSEAEAQDLLAWYRSELGRRITKAEEQASSAAAYQEMISQAESLLVDTERVRIAQRIDELVNATDMSLELRKKTYIAIWYSMSKAMNPGESVDIEAINAQLAEEESTMRQQIAQVNTLWFVYTYRQFSPAEMDKYMDFLERPATGKFSDEVVDGLEQALNESIAKTAASLSRIFVNRKDA